MFACIISDHFLWSDFCDYGRIRACITRSNNLLGVWSRRSFPIFSTRVLSFLHLTLNFLVRYWSRFSKVFRKFFRPIAYISNQKDQSFWKVFRKFFGKFFRSIVYISNQKDQSFSKVFWKVFSINRLHF